MRKEMLPYLSRVIILPHPVLSDRLCYILRDAVSLPPHVQVHSDAVTELACHLCVN